MNVLSLFDGKSSGFTACELAGIEVGTYYSAEIDKYAIQVSNAIHPNQTRLGSVTEWRDWDIEWASIDMIFGGFPCQAWSMAGKQLGDKDERGMLFWTMLDIMKHVRKHNPDVQFLIENVKMKKEFEEYITHHMAEAVGDVHKILINSALVSAQNRNRYYWTSFEVAQPKDRGIHINEILEIPGRVGSMIGRKINPQTGKRDDYNSNIETVQRIELRGDNKTNTLTTVTKDNLVVDEKFFISQKQLDRLDLSSVKDGGARVCFQSPGQNIEKSECLQARDYKGVSGRQYFTVAMVGGRLRKLTPRECFRLQTVPEHYIDKILDCGVSNTQLYKIAGNGWTDEVIAHILRCMPSEKSSNINRIRKLLNKG